MYAEYLACIIGDNQHSARLPHSTIQPFLKDTIMSNFTSNGILTAQGAYGRNAVESDWKDGKDFKILSGPYFSIRDIKALKADGYTHIQFIDSKYGCNAFIVIL